MELYLLREYYPNGTNGVLMHNEQPICHTIELQWRNNEHGESCIPEGRYGILNRFSPKHGHHYILMNVPGRSLILIHPANDAARELKGCIAPVMNHTGEGKGSHSRIAMKQIAMLLRNALKTEPVFITIKSNQHDNQRENRGTYTALL